MIVGKDLARQWIKDEKYLPLSPSETEGQWLTNSG